MTVATFSYANWLLRYPEFTTSVPSPLADQYFAEACLLLDNTDASPVIADPTTFQPRLMLLGMLVAHIAALNIPGSSAIVGRIETAQQGSVSVGAKLEGESAGRAYYAQTKYGLAYWNATARYRTGRYIAPVCAPGAGRPWPWP